MRLLRALQSHAAQAREPRQVRKEAAISGILRVPWERWSSRKGRFFYKSAAPNISAGGRPHDL